MTSPEGQTQNDERAPMRVILAVDNSPNAEHAFKYYANYLHHPSNEIVVLHVSDHVRMPAYNYALLSGGMGAFGTDEVTARIDDLRKKNRILEQKYNTMCKEANIPKHKFLLVTDDHGAGAAIVEAAKKEEVNLIVVGSRGLGVLRRTFMGSISNYVVHHTHIPTLVCPAEQEKQE